jgi:hypothetical protein
MSKGMDQKKTEKEEAGKVAEGKARGEEGAEAVAPAAGVGGVRRPAGSKLSIQP